MKDTLLNTTLAGLLLSASCFVNVANAGLIPTGIQSNITQATIDGWGWSECSRTSASDYSTSTQDVVNSCDGDYMMMAAWDASLNIYAIAAAGETATVTTNTFTNSNDDDNYNTLDNWSNGVNFYKTEGYGSWGFTNLSSVALASADINLRDGILDYGFVGTTFTEEDAGTLAIGLSWHTQYNANFGVGWAYNATGTDHTNISGTGDQRVFFTYSAVDVPEPSTLAIFALGMIGLASRRFKKQS